MDPMGSVEFISPVHFRSLEDLAHAGHVSSLATKGRWRLKHPVHPVALVSGVSTQNSLYKIRFRI